jgi:hypothetical protein
MKRISVTGYVPSRETEREILEACSLAERELRKTVRDATPRLKKEAIKEFGPKVPLKKVRITVEIDVEVL